MMFHRLGFINKEQRGFTIIELMIAIAITGIIITGIAMAIFQVLSVSAGSSNHLTAVRQVQNAGYWISRDAQMAQTVELTPDDPEETKFPLTLTWTDWDGNSHQVIYTLENMIGGPKQLQRQHLTYDADGNPTGDETSIIAQYIIPGLALTNLTYNNSVLTLEITAHVGEWPREASETRTYEVIPRPSL